MGRCDFQSESGIRLGEVVRLRQAAGFSFSRRRSGLRRGVARNRMRTEAGKMPERLFFPIRTDTAFGLNLHGIILRKASAGCKPLISYIRIYYGRSDSMRFLPVFPFAGRDSWVTGKGGFAFAPGR